MEPKIETRLESENEKSMNKNFNNNEITKNVDHEITKKSFDNSSSDDCCKKCGNSEKQELLLLCDKCDNGWHTFCLTPALTEVPEGKSTHIIPEQMELTELFQRYELGAIQNVA